MATRVTLRRKFLSHGRQSLYLDFYPPVPHPETGKPTRRKFLGLHLNTDKAELKKDIDHLERLGKDASRLRSIYRSLMPLSPYDKEYNAETLERANGIRQEYEDQLNRSDSQLEEDQQQPVEWGNQDFIQYFRNLAETKNGGNRTNWFSAVHYLAAFTGGKLKFADLNESLLNAYKEFLLSSKSKRSSNKVLSRNTAASYFNKLRATLKQAFRDKLLPASLYSATEPIEGVETERQYLTREELNKLVKTPCNDDTLKRAALFSALTGLRFTDIQNLRWGNIKYIPDQGYFLYLYHQKTKELESYPINDQAVSFMGEPGSQTSKVFPGLTYSAYSNRHLYQWIGAAGITKNITFHCFRNTFATLLLLKGIDVYTVSKMLGHKYLKTTEMYLKNLDEARRKAANSIHLELP